MRARPSRSNDDAIAIDTDRDAETIVRGRIGMLDQCLERIRAGADFARVNERAAARCSVDGTARRAERDALTRVVRRRSRSIATLKTHRIGEARRRVRELLLEVPARAQIGTLIQICTAGASRPKPPLLT